MPVSTRAAVSPRDARSPSCAWAVSATSTFAPLTIAGQSWTGVQVWTDHPAVACMASQYAGWAINPEGFFAMGSVRCARRRASSGSCSRSSATREDATRGVLVLEGRTCPATRWPRGSRRRPAWRPQGITFAVAPTASVAGGVQIVARVIETGLHKMDTLGFDVTRVRSAIGTAPLPPVAKNDLRAIGRTNDCILYGGQARYLVDAADEELAALAERLAGVRRPRTTARRSTTSSNATTTTSIRSTRCCSAPPRCG